MRSCDTAAIDKYCVPGIVLMENAARGASDLIEDLFGPLTGKSVLIICGKGNNGGDGFAIARHLLNHGMSVHVYNLGPDDASRGDARTNLDILRKMEEETVQLRVNLLSNVTELEEAFDHQPVCIVDALLGTGISSPLVGEVKDIVETVNRSGIPVVAIDVPTGINTDTGEEMGAAIRAKATATMGGLKRGLLFGRGRETAGTVHVVDIGMPQKGHVDRTALTWLLETPDIVSWLPGRRFDAHKYQLGKVFVLAGSIGLTGAAAMASEAALRSGAGIVKLGIPEGLNSILEMKLTEVMTVPLKQTQEGTHSLNSFDEIMDNINSSTVSVIGPGISRHYETQNLVRRSIQSAQAPLVVDADALFALIGHLDILQTADTEIVLTPHVGEFSRLIEQSSADIERKKIDFAQIFAIEFGVTLVLKGAPTVIGCKDGRVYINPTGNPGMATAGSGDILTGIIAGLIAQGASAEQAAACGVFLHGLAGDKAREVVGEYGLIATDMLHTLAQTMHSLAR